MSEVLGVAGRRRHYANKVQKKEVLDATYREWPSYYVMVERKPHKGKRAYSKLVRRDKAFAMINRNSGYGQKVLTRVYTIKG